MEVEDKLIDKINALLERAAHERTPEHEKDACIKKATMLMQKHRVDEAMLRFRQAGKIDDDRRIVDREYEQQFPVEFQDVLSTMQRRVFESFGCQVATKWRKMAGVGYDQDLQMAEMLFSSLYLDFAGKLMVKWESHRSFDENVYRLKESGLSWMQVVHAAPESEGLSKASGSRLRSAHARYAKANGIEVNDRQPQSAERYRASFAQGYGDRIYDRLLDTKRKSNDEVPEEGAIALRRDEDAVREEFYRLYPVYKPISDERLAEWRKKQQEQQAEHDAWWATLTEEQKDRERRKQEREWRAQSARWGREDHRNRPDPAGLRAGRAAADSADLGRDVRVSGNSQKGLA